ncbi:MULTISPECIES: MBL fold metallo-hydrolase [Petrimonas]|jgi:phosphoribosyl 1,2-cyclic phosphodiesterase|uniref:Putative metallo-hydrolase YycJ n=1 Tax=Petrimonas mucosa TaxID=1642646 RepID=A0A1G4G4Z9_9BACT|nr:MULTISPECIES: MBL fold metallo-hydrolase [Petrimonas]MDD3561071.1 MBL fold metallo-hydrolase [Petrimonas mucosa]SCM56053.1 putative metallo-hydrolase YycJ [Petrimonas mucosa]SFU54379.1 Phosphoribosyl 1,2-cyclic phosphodiesterase [Porphyromonadaceae bacterium KHP3R9]HHT30875.1 MBL fold metallo-hydrolase [Petrimonas mucosa]
MQYNLFSCDKFSFFSLGSGSCGNSYYLGNSHYGMLIDAGLGPRVIRKRLGEHGIDFSSIYALLVTHDHYDHIKSAGYLGERLNIPVYATEKVHRGIRNCPLVKNSINGTSRRIIEKGEPFQIEDFRITAFDIPHDSSENTGFFFEFGNHKLTLATDIGAITEELSHYAAKANHLVIESNYDEEMLRSGSYPYYLKQRISNGTGHLSNRQAAEFLANTCTSHLRNIWLCHLSGDNNSPELAYETVKEELARKGIAVGENVRLDVFRRNLLSPKFEL